MGKGIWLAVVLTAVCGCSESGKLRVDGAVVSSDLPRTRAAGDALELAGGRIVVHNARLSVTEIELEGGEDEEREAELGAADIDLALDGTVTQIAVGSVEAGTYHTLGLELRGGDSVLIEGTFDGRPFTFRSGLDPEVEFWLSPEVNVPPDGEASVGVLFDVAAWLVDGQGNAIDPGDPANQGPIEQNILASMAARAELEFEDDD